MRGLLTITSLCCLLATAMSIAIWQRADRATDWLRVNALGTSTVMVSSNGQLGAAIVPDLRSWKLDSRPVSYKHSKKTSDLLNLFPSNTFGFAYQQRDGAQLAVVPLWSVAAAGCVPPMLWIMARWARRRAKLRAILT